MEKLFFELMQVAVGQLDCLSRGPSPEEWAELYQTAQRQAVAGICYNGMEKLFEFGLRAPQDVSIDWMAEAEEIRMSNTIVNKRCATIQKKLIERKIYTSVLLGQGIASCYGAELQELRQPKGIDVYKLNVFCTVVTHQTVCKGICRIDRCKTRNIAFYCMAAHFYAVGTRVASLCRSRNYIVNFA